ncbi:hypothetical protein Kpho02_20990 [Kitasatospora phosalacinea]|uniref:Bacterial Ig-like domain-containing protein n=1 Tax=Kitasatospora phosalacinea TaxID=2065 RepID=A0A9W6V2A3_9ACTN|nr:hypothetical protein [Kitasatospora phosalacinea]GLW69800.1 hypothetical protein Kpho02_20990 [Kitasatospora phosalacinea]
MSDQARPSRPTVEGTDSSGPVPVDFRFSPTRNGTRHLVVVFANFSAPDDYGFSNGVLDQVRANVLWIRDRFNGGNAYYLCQDMDFATERAVAAVIARFVHALDLTHDQVTVFGGSKGGSAALWFGLRHGYGNVLALIPAFRIGTSLFKRRPAAAELMTGGVTPEKVAALDALLPELVATTPHRNTRVYLLTSPQDELYAEQVEPFLPLFADYPDFHLLVNDSPLITGHTTVTARTLPVVLGLLNLLVAGIAPRLGLARTGGEQPDRDTSALDALLAATERFPRPQVTFPDPAVPVPADTVAVGGRAPGAERVSIWLNGKYMGSATTAEDGSWVRRFTRPWEPGEYTLKLFGVAADGEQSPRTLHTFSVVEPAPGLPTPLVTEPADLALVPGPTVRLAGSAPGAERVELVIGEHSLGSAPVTADGSWSWQPAWEWRGGEHTVDVVAQLSGLRPSAPARVTFTVAGALARDPKLQARYGY